MLDTQSKNALTAVLAGVIVIFVAFIYFKKTDKRFVESVTGGNTEKSIQEILEEKNVNTNNINETSPQPILQAKNFNAVWIANDLVFPEIKENKYEVKSGDTLWEIAEAKYGNGSDWSKILEANKDQIGFLQNGSQALIFPGQTLTLP